MTRNLIIYFHLWLATLLTSPFVAGAEPTAKKLKVYILAGQSNMEGHAKTETLDYLRDDPQTAELLTKIVDQQGKPRVADHVWISSLTGGQANGVATGKLTAGYGARPNPSELGEKIGPEFAFGLRMDNALEQPVLIIKTAWGGKSLYHDFRPPSAGVYPRSPTDIERDRYAEADSGKYYRFMLDHVRSVLKDPGRICPAYDPASGYELAGFVWFQGWNDMVNHDVYPRLPADSPDNEYAEYSRLLGHFIRDVRRDLQSPELPFVIGVMGVGGYQTEERYKKQHQSFRDAMAAPAHEPEFQGTVTAIQTADFWDERLGTIDGLRQQVRGRRGQLNKLVESGEMPREVMEQALAKFEAELISPADQAAYERGASNAAYHYLGCGKTFALMGMAFADALLNSDE
ncbi:MAG: sialate O-acetylesterase [Pirellulaceae bacterium]